MTCRVFVAEDEPDLRELYQDLLHGPEFEIVALAPDGESALTAYDGLARPPDVVLLDHRMPGRNGLEVAREIRARDPAARILLASADRAVREEARAAGVSDFLPKVFALADLLRILRRHCAAAHASA